MSDMECVLCGRRINGRSIRPCAGCGAYLCADCARAGHGFCESCAPGSANDSLDAGM